MIILGLNAYHGDASAAIIRDGKVVCAIEEERLRRIKHWAGLPTEAIHFCLHECGIGLDGVDYIAISRDPKANFFKKVIHTFSNGISISMIKDRLFNAKKVGSLKSELEKEFGKFSAKIINVEHHRAHLASTFFASPFEESALLSIDGFGDFTSTMRATGNGLDINVIDSVNYPHSIGIFYTTFTQWLGFMNYGDEYKVMGLAPYGEAKYTDKLWDVVKLKNDGLFELNVSYFKHPKEGVAMSWDGGEPKIDTLYTPYLEDKFGKARLKEENLTQYHKDMAASIQKVCEETIFHILTDLHLRTGTDNVCIAGGVAQNSVANGKIIANTPFKNLYIPPAGHDAGTSIGAALWHYNQVLKNPRIEPMLHGYLGSRYSDNEIAKFLESNNIAYERLEDEALFEKVCNRLINAGVVGWFQGRAEFGPRALGHRSIIADPRRLDAKELLNLKIKRREPFRPFAPSILKEHVVDYFTSMDDVPFMEKVFVIKEDKRSSIPAVTHVDGTGRLQTVDFAVEPKYYGLIEQFYQKTGIPILLNTSFNENEPIVNTPEEAYACFARTKMDMIVMGNIVIER